MRMRLDVDLGPRQVPPPPPLLTLTALMALACPDDGATAASLLQSEGAAPRPAGAWISWGAAAVEGAFPEAQLVGRRAAAGRIQAVRRGQAARRTVRARLGRFSALSVSHHRKSVLCGGFVWARRGPKRRKRRFPARAGAAAARAGARPSPVVQFSPWQFLGGHR
jgi:hypothetical protein